MTWSALAEQPITFYSKGQPALLLEGGSYSQQAEQAPVVVSASQLQAVAWNDALTVAMAQSLAEVVYHVALQFSRVGLSQGQQTAGV